MKEIYVGSLISEEKNKNPLIKREEEVLKEIISDKTQTQISKKIFVSERSLCHHIENIYEKLDVENKVELYAKALELGYVDQS